jgi:hypothetical protein
MQYVTPDRADTNLRDFYAMVKGPGSRYTNWRRSKVYHKGTPDEMVFYLDRAQVDMVNREEYVEAFTKIVYRYDEGDSDNPMKWKFRGRWKRGEYTYNLSPRRNQNWPPLQALIGQCTGKYKFIFSDFKMYSELTGFLSPLTPFHFHVLFLLRVQSRPPPITTNRRTC